MQAGLIKDPLYKFVQFEKYQKKEYLELPEEKGGTPINVEVLLTFIKFSQVLSRDQHC